MGLVHFVCVLTCLASSHEHKSSFKKSKEVCLSYIQDAILQKQWKRAAEFLTFYIESIEKDYSVEYMGPSEVSPCPLSEVFLQLRKNTCKKHLSSSDHHLS